MSCSNNSEALTCASTSVLPTSSVVLPVTQSDINNHNTTLKTLSTSNAPTTTQISKTVNQLIITTTSSGPKIVSQTIPTQKVVSVIPASISGASSSTIGSSSTTNGTSISINGSSSATTSSTDISYPIQHYQTFNDGAIYPNTYYNPPNNQTPSNFPSTTTLAPNESQTYQLHYVYPEGSIELDNGYDIDGHVSHTAQAAPVTVQWLVDNFEPAEGCSLRRASLYNFYSLHCQEQKIEPVNAASFGKLIRSVFLGLRTRRLGTRGNSKYHYYGIRVKASSHLNQIPEDHAVPSRNHSLNPPKRIKTAIYSEQEFKTSPVTPTVATVDLQTNHGTVAWTPTNVSNSHGTAVLQNNTNVLNDATTATATLTITTDEPVIASTSQTAATSTPPPQTTPQPRITATTSTSSVNNLVITESEARAQECARLLNSLPSLGNIDIENVCLPDNIIQDDLRKFEELYKHNCQKVLDLVVELRLSGIDEVWKKFWRSPQIDFSEYENVLPSEKLLSLCCMKEVIEFVKSCDYQFYQFCVDTIIPDVLRPLPPNFTQQIRNFAKSSEIWLRNALINVPKEMQQVKLKIINAFAMTLRRYTTLSHLVTAARSLVQNHASIDLMLHDINRVDFRTVHSQAAWVCKCDDEGVYTFLREFKRNLENYCSVEDWVKWLDASVTLGLQKYEGTEKYTKMAQQFLLKWSFYCSLTLRDLTLRSALSFGSYHLMKLLQDEYISYVVENKIAKASNQTIIAVMSDVNLIHGQFLDD